MAKIKELSYTQLKKTCDPAVFKFKTTKELEPFVGTIGQSRGIKAMEFGLNIDIKGYNLYLEGPTGIGKTIYARDKLSAIAKTNQFQMIGAMFIILQILMNLLQFLYRLKWVENLQTI